MKASKGTTSHDKKILNKVFEGNLQIAGEQLVGISKSKKLVPSKENLKKFQKQFEFNQHSLCGCYSCVELGKLFVKNDRNMVEEVIAVSTKDIEDGNY